MRVPFCIAFFIVVVCGAPLLGDCVKPISCGTTLGAKLDYVAGSCWDSQLRTYDMYTFDAHSGDQMTAVASSPSFAPELLLLDPNNAQKAAGLNPSSASSVTLTYTFPSSGMWTLELRNSGLSGDGPYSLSLQCSQQQQPPPPPQKGFTLVSSPGAVTLKRGESGTLSVYSSTVAPTPSAVTVIASAIPSGVSLNPSTFTFASPGQGVQAVRLSVSDTAPGGIFFVTFSGSSADRSSTAAATTTLTIDAPCAPPFLFQQPTSVTVTRGTSATLHADPSGTPPFSFQWYRGATGSTYFPDPKGRSADYQTPTLDSDDNFWVRISNDCGSRDSATVTVKVVEPPPPPPRRRSVRH